MYATSLLCSPPSVYQDSLSTPKANRYFSTLAAEGSSLERTHRCVRSLFLKDLSNLIIKHEIPLKDQYIGRTEADWEEDLKRKSFKAVFDGLHVRLIFLIRNF